MPFSCVNPTKTPKISSLLHSGKSLSIPSIGFRSKNLAKGVHQGGSSGRSSIENAEHKISSVSRRLASPQCNKKATSQRQRNHSQSPFSTRVFSKCKKIKSGTNSRYHIYRRKVLTRQGNCHANSRQDSKVRKGSFSSDGNRSVCKAVFTNSWSDGLLYRNNTKCKTIHETIQLHLLHWWKPVSSDLESVSPKSQCLVEHLCWWLQEANIVKGRSLSQSQANKIIATEACTHGWSGNLDHQIVQGIWSEEQKEYHINCLELQAVLLTL